MRFPIKPIVLALAALQLAACSHMGWPNNGQSRSAREAVGQAADAARQKDDAAQGVIEHVNAPFVDFEKKPVHPFAGDVSLQVSNAPVGSVLVELARRSGLEISFADNIDLKRQVTVTVRDVTGKYAMKHVASAAGYVAIVNENTKTVSIAETATHVYKLPPSLLSSMSGSFNAGGNPMTGGGGGGGGGNANAGVQANFSIKGEIKGASAKSFLEQVKEIGGKDATYSLNEERGLLTVRGSAQALTRVNIYVMDQVREASTQIWAEVTVAEVSLSRDFSMGVDWSKIFNVGNGLTATLRNAAATATGNSNNPLAIAYTNADSRLVVNALMKHSDVRVISSPTLMLTNHVPASIFQGRTEPYLPSITTTVTGTAGTSQSSAQAAFATSGLMLSAVADVISDKKVSLTLMPVLTRVEGFTDLAAGSGNVLKVPQQASNSTTLTVQAETGRTLIMGGVRTSSGSANRALTGFDDGSDASELIFLIRTKVLQPEMADPLVAELL